jgi:hypothetical protein
MMSVHPHLNPDAALLVVDGTDGDRIRHIQRDRFIEHEPVSRVLELLEDFVVRPPSIRPPCLALIADAGSGKSTLMAEFMRRVDSAAQGSTARKAVYLIADPYPDLRSLQLSLLAALEIPHPVSVYRKQWVANELIRRAIVELCVRVVVIDEAAHLLNLRASAGAAVYDWLKWISTACRVSVVCCGIPGAEEIVLRERQLQTRFTVMRLPKWKTGPAFAQFLTAYERSLPLKRQSGLGAADMQVAILRESRVKQGIDGVTHGIKQVVEHAAIQAIHSGTERITVQELTAWRGIHGLA